MNKQTIIILEGHDMVGKTSIGEELSEMLNIPLFKCAKHNQWHDQLIDLIYAGETLTQFLEQTKTSVIFDRLFPSEFAYAKAYDRPTSYKKIMDIDSRYAKMNAKIIIFYKNSDCYEDDDTGLIKTEMYENIHNAFVEFSNLSECDVLLLNTSDKNLGKQLEKIISFINK